MLEIWQSVEFSRSRFPVLRGHGYYAVLFLERFIDSNVLKVFNGLGLLKYNYHDNQISNCYWNELGSKNAQV